MSKITYNGTLPKIELGGYGHFAPGDSKTIDELTAAGMDNDTCAAEGWVVETEGKKTKKHADADEPTKPAAEHRRTHEMTKSN